MPSALFLPRSIASHVLLTLPDRMIPAADGLYAGSECIICLTSATISGEPQDAVEPEANDGVDGVRSGGEEEEK